MHGRGALGAVAMVLLAACAQDHTVTGLAAERTPSLTSSPTAGTDVPGAVYALTNQVGGNAVAIYARAADGSLSGGGWRRARRGPACGGWGWSARAAPPRAGAWARGAGGPRARRVAPTPTHD